MDHGTDRDVALSMVEALNTCSELVSSINDNLYVPHITTQPTNQEASLNETATFSVVANNVARYLWRYRPNSESTWRNTTGEGNDTASYTITVSSAGYYNNEFRCKITGKDGSIIYSNVVKVVAPES